MRNDIQVNIYNVDPKPDYSSELYDALRSHLNVRIRSFVAGEPFIEYVHTHGVSCRQIHVAVVAFQHTSAVEYVMNGLEILEFLRRVAPSVRVIMVGSQEDLEFGVQASKNGAAGVVMYTQCTSLQLSSLVLRIVSPLRIAIRKRQVVAIIIQLLLSISIFGISLFYILYQ